jgi:exodeoxyribonuclease VII large subunit
MGNRLAQDTHHLESLTGKVSQLAERQLTRRQHQLEQLSLRLQTVDPQVLLKRGYSITYRQGKVVRDASQLASGEEIETRLAKGSVHSIVK